MAKDVRRTLKRATRQVLEPDTHQLPVRTRPLPNAATTYEVIEEPDTPVSVQETRRKTKNFAELVLTGSQGKKYRVTVPASYLPKVPRVWEWTEERYKIAEAIGQGIPMKQVAELYDVDRAILYGWLEHPEFREHIDGLVMETGFANRRERIQQVNRLAEMLMQKVAAELDTIRLNEKSIGAVLTSIAQLAKHLAQEKEEFIESSKIEQQTTISGALGVAAISVDSVLNGKSSEERAALEQEFNSIGDEIIRGLVGDKG